ncbi:unnamed protein product [Caenorhabditis bovis]|uniref:Arrestin C-terminal-like domain-containing protein n=1 Tax=Caenorhabditis bovis TaxID=2654633 RepID=A0A8S1FBG4_9PELO|nr:unnamed protein product [Caenorhabditis bovis]
MSIFRAKLAAIQIRLAGDRQVFFPGDLVAGTITVEIPDGFKARKLTTRLVGKAYTYWEGDARNNTKIKNNVIVRVRHNTADHHAKMIYVKAETATWKNENSRHEWSTGTYNYPFSFQLPLKCPPSFEGELGYIRYFIKVVIDRPWKFDDKLAKCFTVLPVVDLSAVRNAKVDSRRHICERVGSFWWNRGVVKLELKLTKQGFVPGEEMECEITVDNNSKTNFNKLQLCLIQSVTYTGFRDGFQGSKCEKNSSQVLVSTRLNSQMRVDDRTFFDETIDANVQSNSKEQIVKNILIPALCPSIKCCDLIEVDYKLKLKLKPSGNFANSIKLEAPFIIGTLPTEKIDKKFEYKKSVFGYNGTRLRTKNFQKFAPMYPSRTATRNENRKTAAFAIFVGLIRLFKLSCEVFAIEGSATNLKCLLTCAKNLSEWFEQVFTRLPPTNLMEHFEEYLVTKQLTTRDVAVNSIPGAMINEIQKARYNHHLDVKKACQEQKAFRESFLRSQTDFDIDFEDGDVEDDTKLLSIEEAVLIIQKLERKYQAISRRNYVRFVREGAAEFHGVKTEIDATQAAIRIQARTRGYFARKYVREMRDKELKILNMKPESLIEAKCNERSERRVVLNWQSNAKPIGTFPNDLEDAIEMMRNAFYVALDDDEEKQIVQAETEKTDTLYLDACYRGIVASLGQFGLAELISQKERVKIDGRCLIFDIVSFVTITLAIPLALSTWKPMKPRWMLLIGGPGSGRRSIIKAVSNATFHTHIHISKNAVTMGKRKIYTTARKLAKYEKRLLISIDKIDILKIDKKTKALNHRQLLLTNFLADISHTSATVVGMSRTDELQQAVHNYFQLQVYISQPRDDTRYDLAANCLSRNLEQDRLAKVPQRIFDIEKQTQGLSYGKAVKFVTNRWSAANATKTNQSI